MGRRKGVKKGPMTLFDKVKKLDPYFAADVVIATEENLKEKLLQIAKDQDANESAQNDDVDLKSLRAQLKTVNETYTRPLKACKLKRQLIIQILNDRSGKPT